jgi:hypothetical protein
MGDADQVDARSKYRLIGGQPSRVITAFRLCRLPAFYRLAPGRL